MLPIARVSSFFLMPVMRRTPDNNAELCEGQEQVHRERCVNRVLIAWIADIGFVLDRLERLNASDTSDKFKGADMARVGVFGTLLVGDCAAILP